MSTEMTRRTFVSATAAAGATIAAAGAMQAIAHAAEGTPAADGTYTTDALGRGGYFYVDTTFQDGKIVAVKPHEDHLETALIANYCFPIVEQAMIENNSYQVDIVAGCTYTCAAMMTAVREAIIEAGGSPEYYENMPEIEVPADEEIECDICVIGAGISGCDAAAKAAADGARVVLLEKSVFFGGCSLHSSGISVLGTTAQREAGQDADTEIREKFNKWLDYQHYRVDAGLLYTYLSNGGRAVDFFNESGMFFPNAPEGYRLPPYADRPAAYEELLSRTVLANGGELRPCTTAKSLIQDEDGRIVGVNAETKAGSKVTVHAKAVIIASGGYGGDLERVWKTSHVHAVSGAFDSNIGEGIDMAYAVGAAVPANTSGLQLHQTLATAQLRGFDYFHLRMPMILCYSWSLLHVDKAGVRYRNELNVRSPTAAAGSAAFTGDCTYVLVSQSTIDALETGGMVAMGTDKTPGLPPLYKPQFDETTVWTDVNAVLDECVANGWAYYGETPEELAQNAGFDVDTFVNTFNTYQGYCEQGFDEYYAKPAEYLVKYEYGPYYLIESTYNQLGTICGLAVNNKMQVLDENKRPIPGLYSSGADAESNLYDRMYSGSGDALGWSCVSGFLAGEAAAAEVLA